MNCEDGHKKKIFDDVGLKKEAKITNEAVLGRQVHGGFSTNQMRNLRGDLKQYNVETEEEKIRHS